MKLTDISLKAQVAVMNRMGDFYEKHSRKVDTVERVAQRLTILGPVSMLMLLTSEPAMAMGLGDWFRSFIQGTAKPILEGAVWLFYACGVLVSSIGIWKFIQCSRQNSHASPIEASAYTFGGGALGGIGYIADRAAESMSMGSGSWNARTL